MDGAVTAVSQSPAHRFSKEPQASIRLLAGLGVEGDAHAGVTMQHRSRWAKQRTAPNLRQVHLLHEELFEELAGAGFAVAAAELGENVTTRGVDLLALPVGARLGLGPEAVVELTGLRNPCVQIDRFQPGLMAAVTEKDARGVLVGKVGVMGIVVAGGEVRPGDAVGIELPAGPHRRLPKGLRNV